MQMSTLIIFKNSSFEWAWNIWRVMAVTVQNAKYVFGELQNKGMEQSGTEIS